MSHSPNSRSLFALALLVALSAGTLVAHAQAYSSSSSSEATTLSAASFFVAQVQSPVGTAPRERVVEKASTGPFSSIGFAAAVSPLGIGAQVAANLSGHVNIRAQGSYFQYTISDITTNGFTVTPKLSLANAGTAIDIYPFHRGFRISPGVLFYNGNKANATYAAAAGTSFTLNNYTYYSASGVNAVRGTGTVSLGKGSPAFTITTGWGNMAKAKGHWSFPVEVGIALITAPKITIALSGLACDAQGLNCVNVATDPDVQSNLTAQIVSYQNDLNPLKTYPIVSFGVSYSIHLR